MKLIAEELDAVINGRYGGQNRRRSWF